MKPNWTPNLPPNWTEIWPQARGFLPNLLGIGLITAARFTGAFQVLEWMAYDAYLRHRPPEALDDRVVIVGIDEDDIQRIGTYPIPDGDIADLLTQLQAYSPEVIGLDNIRDLPVEPGHAQLQAALREMDNLIAVERVLEDREGYRFQPPPGVPDDRLGFIDAVPDTDGFLRRSFLGAYNPNEEYRFSLTIQLASAYLETYDLSLTNGIRDPIAMRFGSTELPRFQPNTGSYVRANDFGNQTLINFRSGPNPFRIVSLTEVMSGSVDPEWFRDRVVLVGVTALSVRDIVNSAAVDSPNPGLVYGVEIQAHATSQILSAVLDNRPLLRTWSEGWEYLWIVAWGLIGLSLTRLFPSPFKTLWLVALASGGLLGLSYLLLLYGWWVPLVPAWIAFMLNGVVLYGFYLYDRALRAQIQSRQQVIEQTFTAIHNGPLQTLAQLLRREAPEAQLAPDLAEPQQQSSAPQAPAVPPGSLYPDLVALNRELRDVYEAVRQETLTQSSQMTLGDRALDLQAPLHEILYQVYDDTLRRDFPCFTRLKVKVVKFESMAEQYLSLAQRRDLCRFLEEALCNVGKYATGATRLTVTCAQDQTQNVIRVKDNGIGLKPDLASDAAKQAADESSADSQPESNKASTKDGGRGTLQAQNLARSLGGNFARSPQSPKGTLCELTWPTQPPKWWQRLAKLVR